MPQLWFSRWAKLCSWKVKVAFWRGNTLKAFVEGNKRSVWELSPWEKQDCLYFHCTLCMRYWGPGESPSLYWVSIYPASFYEIVAHGVLTTALETAAVTVKEVKFEGVKVTCPSMLGDCGMVEKSGFSLPQIGIGIRKPFLCFLVCKMGRK